VQRATRAVHGAKTPPIDQDTPSVPIFQTSTFRFETAVPVLRDLPLLFAVVSGRLCLSGWFPEIYLRCQHG